MSTAKERFVDRLRDAMHVVGVNQRQLSERSGVNARSLQEYLSGRRRMPADALPGIAKALGVSCDYLLTGEPAAFDAGILWQALNDPRFARGAGGGLGPVSEHSARAFYGAYTDLYLMRASNSGRVFPYWERSHPLIQAFIDRMEVDDDPLIKHMREIFPEV